MPQRRLPRSKWVVSRFLAVTAAILLAASAVTGQEASSHSNAPSASPVASPTGPSAALRDALTAACAHDQQDFSRFLTERNRASFSRMTEASRIALMKRLVLLDDAGKPTSSTNPAGRPLVTCKTPLGAAEIQLGGADQQENLAFLPVDLRDATDAAGSTAMHINVGMVREGNQWKLLSVGLVLLDLPALEVEWDTAEIATNEGVAIQGLKSIAEAVETYRRTYTRLPESLAQLGPSARGGAAGAEGAGLIDAELASGKKSGYTFRYVILGANSLGAPAQYELAASPASYGRTGKRSFFRDADGKIHGADRQGALGSPLDPRVD